MHHQLRGVDVFLCASVSIPESGTTVCGHGVMLLQLLRKRLLLQIGVFIIE